MYRTMLPLLVVALATAAEAEPPSAEELTEKSIAYHDPEGLFLSAPHHLSLIETRPGGSDRETEALIDVPGERFELIWKTEVKMAGTLDDGHCTMTLDGRDASEVSEEERKEHRLSCERLTFLKNYYIYVWGLPMKLRDPGTHLGEVTETTFAERDVYGLRVTYEPGVGDDIWYFYFDRETYALTGYRFYHDEAKGDGEYITLEGEVEAGGLRVPKTRAWYTHQGDRHLGTDTLVGIDRRH